MEKRPVVVGVPPRQSKAKQRRIEEAAGCGHASLTKFVQSVDC